METLFELLLNLVAVTLLINFISCALWLIIYVKIFKLELFVSAFYIKQCIYFPMPSAMLLSCDIFTSFALFLAVNCNCEARSIDNQVLICC